MADRELPLAERHPAMIERDAALAHLDFLKNTRSWRITRPLRFLMRLIRWGLTPEDRSRLIQWWANLSGKQGRAANANGDRSGDAQGPEVGRVRSFATLPALPALHTQQSLESTAAGNSKFDVICFANIEWSARFQRPQQMMRQFAEHGHRVFYVVASRRSPGRQTYSLNEVSRGGIRGCTVTACRRGFL